MYWFSEAFHEMDQRRLSRFMTGKKKPASNSSIAVRALFGFIVCLFLFTHLSLRFDLERIVRSEFLTTMVILASLLVCILTLVDCITTRDHMFVKISLAIFVVCSTWYVRYFLQRDRHNMVVDRMVTSFMGKEQVVFKVFLILQAANFLLHFCIMRLFPRLGKFVRNDWIIDRFWYRFKQTELTVTSPNHRIFSFSYRPYGLCCRRRMFRYEGQVSELTGLPDGLGIWADNSYHGESLVGLWREGEPVAPFRSREKGSEAVFMCHPILYATSKAETFGQANHFPGRSKSGLRYGLASVEASCGGAFYEDIPRVLEYRESNNLGLLVDEWRERMKVISCGKDVLISDCTALVFFHGFNCTEDFALCKVSQLLALGSFPHTIIPFVFSHSAGMAFSYFPVRSSQPIFAEDAVEFIRELRELGLSHFHLLGHSLGCDLLMMSFNRMVSSGVVSQVREIHQIGIKRTESRLIYEPSTSGSIDSEEPQKKLQIDTIILLNADVSLEMFKHELNTTRAMERCVGRITCYVDNHDRALFVAYVATREKKVGSMCKREILTSDPNIKLSRFLDIIDTTGMQQNVHSLRHSYFNLNVQIVADIEAIYKTYSPAAERSLVALGNEFDYVYQFLCPPAFLDADRAAA